MKQKEGAAQMLTHRNGLQDVSLTPVSVPLISTQVGLSALEETGRQAHLDLDKASNVADVQEWWRMYRAIMGDYILVDILLYRRVSK